MKAGNDTRARALSDIAWVLGLSAAAFAIELAAASVLPWGPEARGVLAVLTGAVAALVVTRARGSSLAELGFRRPRRWWTVPFWVIGIFAVFVVAQGAVPALLSAFVELPPPDMSRYDFLKGNAAAALAMGVALPLVAAVPEEIVYRGFLIDRFATAFDALGRWRRVLAVLAQALVFGAVHFQWGAGGIVFATVMGIVWGIGFELCGRNLWVVILAHSLAHVALVAQLYAS